MDKKMSDNKYISKLVRLLARFPLQQHNYLNCLHRTAIFTSCIFAVTQLPSPCVGLIEFPCGLYFGPLSC